MAPPNFRDLGKDAGDLLSKGFYLNVFNFKCDTVNNDLKLKSSINHSFKAKKIAFSWEPELKLPKYNVTIAKKWSSDNVLDVELSIKDKLIADFDQTFKVSWNANTDAYHVNLANELKKDTLRMNVDMFFKSAIPDFTPSLVFSHLGYLAGVDLKLDSSSRTLQRMNLALGYSVHDFAFHGLIADWGKRYSANLYQRLSDRLELAGSISWGREKEDVAWSVGGKYLVDEQKKHSVKVKFDHLNRISLSSTTFLTKGLKMSLSSMFNGPELPQLGLAFELSC